MTSSKHYEKLRKHKIRIKTKKLVRNIIRPGSVEKTYPTPPWLGNISLQTQD